MCASMVPALHCLYVVIHLYMYITRIPNKDTMKTILILTADLLPELYTIKISNFDISHIESR